MLFSFLCFLEWDNKNTVTSRIPARFPDCPFQIFRNKVFSDVAGGIYRLKLSDGCWKQFVNAQLLGKFCEFVTPFFGGWWKREHFQWWKRDFQRSGMKRSRLGHRDCCVDIWLVLSGEVFANSVVGIVEIFFTQKVADWKNHAGIENCVNRLLVYLGGGSLLMFRHRRFVWGSLAETICTRGSSCWVEPPKAYKCLPTPLPLKSVPNKAWLREQWWLITRSLLRPLVPTDLPTTCYLFMK